MEYRLLMFLQNSIRGPVQNKIMWCITSLEDAGFLSIAACLALLLQPRYRRVGQAATVSMILEFMLVNLVLKNWVARVRPYHLLEDLILLAREPMDYSFPSGHTAQPSRWPVSCLSECRNRSGFRRFWWQR